MSETLAGLVLVAAYLLPAAAAIRRRAPAVDGEIATASVLLVVWAGAVAAAAWALSGRAGDPDG